MKLDTSSRLKTNFKKLLNIFPLTRTSDVHMLCMRINIYSKPIEKAFLKSTNSSTIQTMQANREKVEGPNREHVRGHSTPIM